ncbi:MAG: HD domain-containing protein [Coriobacteriia bacterium]|nr:HD domain-containing protein [Coriobacteriia bacterium]
MGRQYAGAMSAGESVDATFSLRAKEMRSSRAGEAYLSLEFGDRSGRIGGIMFRPGRDAESVPTGTVVHVRGTVTEYRGILRISVGSMKPALRYELRELLPASPRDTGEMMAELREHTRAIKDRDLSAVVKAVFGDREYMARFRSCPASRSDHHAYVGGLLEHTVAVAGICRTMSDLYPQIDDDLLLAGALLHDIGVVDTLEFSTSIELTEHGRLLGAAILGERRLSSVVTATLDARSGVLDQLRHMILSHSGGPGAESGLRPCTLEASVLSHAHELDARAASLIASARGAGMVGESWTGDGVRVIPPRSPATRPALQVAG